MAGASKAADGHKKHTIKKLTKEKIEQYKDEILGASGQANLASRGIESIVSLHGLKHATKLDLSRNKLTKLSDMKRVPNLTMLKLTGNNLNGEGVAEIQHLKKLVIFNAAENRISRISMDVLLHLRSLKALVLNDNAITTLDWIPKLPELNSLIVSDNRISQIPERLLTKLPNLTKISISRNQLKDLPDLSSLTQLTELRLSHNKLTKVPAHLAKLEYLKVLELGHNEIDDWAGIEAISALPSLKQLVLRGNPIAGKALEVSIAEDKAAKEAAAEEGAEAKEETEEEQAHKLKLFKKLDATNKQYNFRINRLFPMLVVRDGQRVMNKKTHGYVAPPKEKKEKKEKPQKKEKSEKKDKSKARKSDGNEVADEIQPAQVKHDVRIKRERTADGDAQGDNEVAAVAEPSKKSKSNSGEPQIVDIKAKQKLTSSHSKSADKATGAGKVKKEKKEKREKKAPKDVESGVVAVKQLKSAKKAAKPVDFSTGVFTPNVGFGGSSAWD